MRRGHRVKACSLIFLGPVPLRRRVLWHHPSPAGLRSGIQPACTGIASWPAAHARWARVINRCRFAAVGSRSPCTVLKRAPFMRACTSSTQHGRRSPQVVIERSVWYARACSDPQPPHAAHITVCPTLTRLVRAASAPGHVKFCPRKGGLWVDGRPRLCKNTPERERCRPRQVHAPLRGRPTCHLHGQWIRGRPARRMVRY